MYLTITTQTTRMSGNKMAERKNVPTSKFSSTIENICNFHTRLVACEHHYSCAFPSKRDGSCEKVGNWD